MQSAKQVNTQSNRLIAGVAGGCDFSSLPGAPDTNNSSSRAYNAMKRRNEAHTMATMESLGTGSNKNSAATAGTNSVPIGAPPHWIKTN